MVSEVGFTYESSECKSPENTVLVCSDLPASNVSKTLFDESSVFSSEILPNSDRSVFRGIRPSLCAIPHLQELRYL